jgi:hypothetical protein
MAEPTRAKLNSAANRLAGSTCSSIAAGRR